MSLEKLESLRREMQKCVRCSLCKLVPMPTIQDTRFTGACPPIDEYHFHAYSGGGMQVMALALLDGRIQADADLARIVAACTTCGQCDVSCKYIMAAERLDVIMALKEHLIETGHAVTYPRKNEQTSRQWMNELKIKSLPRDQAEVLLFVGTAARYDETQAKTAWELARLLQAAHVDFGILGDAEPDSGIDAYWTGQRNAFVQQASRVVDVLDQTRVKTIVTLCGEDLGMFRSKYPAYARAPQARTLHASEFLLPLIRQKRLRLECPVNQQVTWHDPCYLGRQSEPPHEWHGEERLTHGVMTYFVPPKPINYGVNGLFDAPRDILRAIPGLDFTEMYRIREYAYCCGGGGGVPVAHPNVARSAALHRIDEARAVGAQAIVTGCSRCRRNLTRWQNETLPVFDLIGVIYQATGLSPHSDE